MDALAVWRLFPAEIATDLSRFHRRRIAEWHTGTMSSFELLELCEFMPEHGAFKPALARFNPVHEWLIESPSPVAAILQAANELSILRAAQVPQADSDEIGSQIFLSAATLRARIEERLEVEQAREDIFAMADQTPKG